MGVDQQATRISKELGTNIYGPLQNLGGMTVPNKQLIHQIMNYAGDLSPDDTAEVAGRLMSEAGVNKETVDTFLRQLSEDDRAEFYGQVESFDEREQNDEWPESQEEPA